MTNWFKGSTENIYVQLLRYVFVGGSAFILDFSTLYFMTRYLHVYYLISAGIAFVLGIILNYILSTLWVFDRRNVENRWVEGTVFTIIGLIGLGLNELLMYFFTDHLRLYFMFSKVFSTAIVFGWNFFARKFLLFNGKGERKAE